MRYVFLFAVFSLFLAGCELYEDLDLVSVNKTQIGKIEDGKLNLTVNADIENPNAYNIKVKTTDLQVYVNDHFIGTAVLKDAVKLKRKSTTTYDFPIAVGLEKGAVQRIFALSLKKEVMLTIKGKIKASVLGLNRSISVNRSKIIDPSKIKR